MGERLKTLLCASSALVLLACGGDGTAMEDGGDLPDAAMDAPRSRDAHFEAGPDADFDAGAAPDAMVPEGHPTLSDYRRCVRDSDCPIGFGECVVELALSHVDPDGTAVVSVAALDPSFAEGEGVCTRTCTTDPASCNGLALRDAEDALVTYTCQVVAAGRAPYPSPAPALPFDYLLSQADLELGQAFAALCRPPFGLDPAVDDDLCAPCDAASPCAEGTCVDLATNAVATAGVCAPTCEGDICPFGFACLEVDGGGDRLCLPTLGSCGACVDHDGDERGIGACLEPGHDCDDAEADGYFDLDAMEHAFPDHCGRTDLNCNGLSDDAEQLGTAAYGAMHCETCFDACDGAVSRGTLHCDPGGDGLPPLCTVECSDPLIQASCDGDERTGCETDAAGGTTYYRDSDRDGFGAAGNAQISCSGADAPDGFVVDDTDCADDLVAVHPGAPEACNDRDDDCDGATDESVLLAYYLDGDGDGRGVEAGMALQACSIPVGFAGNNADCDDGDPSVFGAVDDLPGADEICNGADDDCDASSDEGLATSTYYRDQDGDGAGDPDTTLDRCRPPTGYVSNAADCAPSDESVFGEHGGAMVPAERCDGIDNDCDGQTDAADVTAPTYSDPDEGSACSDAPALGTCADGARVCGGGAFSCVPSDPAPFDDPALGLGLDTDCDGVTPTYLYVDPVSGADGNTGAAGSPLKKVSEALSRIRSGASSASQVLVGQGAPAEEHVPIEITSGVLVVGGCSNATGTWVCDAAARSSVSRSNTAVDGRVVGAHGAALTAALPGGLVRLNLSVTGSLSGGADTYGVHCDSCPGLILRDVDLSVGNAGNGVTASPGLTGDSGGDGDEPHARDDDVVAQGLNDSCPGRHGGFGGLAVNRPATSDGNDAGTYASGSGRGGAGGDGATGTAGANGGRVTTTAGPGGDDGGEPLQIVGGYLAPSPVSIDSPAVDGNGGGGGIGLVYKDGCASGWAGSRGPSGGAGGCGGGLGGVGGNGGNVIGIYLSSGLNASLVNVTLSYGDGGDGVDGAQGGDGGDGGAGGLVSETTVDTAVFCPFTSWTDGGDGSGGAGGAGGRGGNGGVSVGLLTRSDVDLCGRASTSDTSAPIFVAGSGNAGTAGLGATGGSGGQRGASTSMGTRGATGGAGLNGRDGRAMSCFWSRGCGATTPCPANQYCLGSVCLPTLVRR